MLLHSKDKMAEGFLDNLQQDAKRVQQLQKQVLAKKARDLAKASTGRFSVGRKAAIEKYKLARKVIQQLPEPKTDEDILKIAGLESYKEDKEKIFETGFYNYLKELEESSNFIKSLVDRYGVSKEEAEKAWKIASKSFEKSKFKNVKGERKYKIIAGLAKKIVKESREIAGMSLGAELSQVGGSAFNTDSSTPFVFGYTETPMFKGKSKKKRLRKEENSATITTSSAGDISSPGGSGNYAPSIGMFSRVAFFSPVSRKRKRKNRKESEDINNYIDKLFE